MVIPIIDVTNYTSFVVALTNHNRNATTHTAQLYFQSNSTYSHIHTTFAQLGPTGPTGPTGATGPAIVPTPSVSGIDYNLLMIDVSGNTVKSSVNTSAYDKTFVIDHPNLPDRYLVHACLEGPEAGVYYRGTGVIKNGTHKCSIVLPDYTSKFNDFTAHVTCKGIPMLLGVSDVEYGYFSVFSEKTVHKDIHFNWVVYGKRNDITIEPFKSEITLKGDGPYLWI